LLLRRKPQPKTPEKTADKMTADNKVSSPVLADEWNNQEKKGQNKA
jgi:hypothetical protein